MLKETKVRKTINQPFDGGQTDAHESEFSQTRVDSAKSETNKRQSHLDDSAEMFAGLITGDENFHNRSSAFVPLWG